MSSFQMQLREWLNYVDGWIFFVGGWIARGVVWFLIALLFAWAGIWLLLKLCDLARRSFFFVLPIIQSAYQAVVRFCGSFISSGDDVAEAPALEDVIVSPEFKLETLLLDLPEPSPQLLNVMRAESRPTFGAFRNKGTAELIVPTYDAYFLWDTDRIDGNNIVGDLWCNVAFLSAENQAEYVVPSNTLLVVIDTQAGVLEISERSTARLAQGYQRLLLERVAAKAVKVQFAVGGTE